MGEGLKRARKAARATRQKKGTHPSTLEGLTNLGRNVRGLVRVLPDIVSWEVEERLGRDLTRCMKAGLKAAFPGMQTDKQIAGILPEFREAFNRQLGRVYATYTRESRKRHREVQGSASSTPGVKVTLT